jgi:hypothetical protein
MDAGNQVGVVTYGGGQYLVVLDQGFSYDPVNDTFLIEDVYGVFITP